MKNRKYRSLSTRASERISARNSSRKNRKNPFRYTVRMDEFDGKKGVRVRL